MAGSTYTARIKVDADGRAARTELDRVGDAARDADREVEDLDGERVDVDTSSAVSALDRVGDAANDADREIAGIEGPSGGLADSVGGIAGNMKIAAGATGAAGFALALKSAVDYAAENAESAAILSEALGISLRDAGLLENLFEDYGVDLEGVYGIMEQFNDALMDSPELADDLGIALGPNGVLDPVEGIGSAIDNWDLIDPKDKMTLFGEEGVLAISRMVATGKDFETLANDISETRFTSEEDLENLRAYREVTRELKQLWIDIVGTVGGDLLESIKNLSDPVGYVKSEFREIGTQLGLINDDNDEAIDKLNQMADEAGLYADEMNEGRAAADGLVESIKLIPDKTTTEVQFRYTTDGMPPGYSYPSRPGGRSATFQAASPASVQRAVTTAPAAAAVTTINVNVARTSDMRDVDRAITRWARINGRRATEFRAASET